MTENEFRKLPRSVRQAMPLDDIFDIILQTHAEVTEAMLMQGWEFVEATDNDPEYLTELWRRETGGVVEWVELYLHDTPPALEPCRCWLVAYHPTDPRLIED